MKQETHDKKAGEKPIRPANPAVYGKVCVLALCSLLAALLCGAVSYFPVTSMHAASNAPATADAMFTPTRLPTEGEWEFAARGGLAGTTQVWVEKFKPNGNWMPNTFQGHFPDQDSGADGFVDVAPVGKSLPNGFGLYDMAGNVWQWTSDCYRPDYYAQLAKIGGVAHNPRGPGASFDPSEPSEKKKVHRGGSFLCTDQYCSRYVVGTRGKGEASSGTNHLSFRCVSNKETRSRGRNIN